MTTTRSCTPPNKLSKWEWIGTVGVDSGTIALVDPCYSTLPVSTPADPDAHDWSDGVVGRIFTGTGDDIELGVIVTSGRGDGFYPVEARYTADGVIAEVRVRFLTAAGGPAQIEAS